MDKKVSVVTVNYNGKSYLGPFFESLSKMAEGERMIEIIMVDNLSQDNSVSFVKNKFPMVKVLRNDVNNYVKAVNMGIAHATGEYIVLVNNDTIVDPGWLVGLVGVMEADERIGAVQSKILFSDGKGINSVGVAEIEDFYFRDIGFGEKDSGRYEKVKEIEYFSGGSVMLRRECLEEVGGFDEDYMMFFEDIEYSIRCRKKGWKLFYSPSSIVYHKYHGSASEELCDYLCTKNRFLCLATHFPERLTKSIKSSHFYLQKRYDFLYRALICAVKKMVECHDAEKIKGVFWDLGKEVECIFGKARAFNFFSQLEVALGLRKIRVGIYDHAFHFAGGGQRYVAILAEILQKRYDVTYIANKDISFDKYKEWFDINLSGCALKVIKIPFFERIATHFIDEGMVVNERENPFDIISAESMRFDVFINANMLGKVRPLSTVSVFVCHFPDRERERFFHADKYDYLVSNGYYTSSWIKKRWGLDPTCLIYPPVDMYSQSARPAQKKKLILSVARFEVGGSKKQVELVKAFVALASKNGEIKNNWKLVLAGGSFQNNPYYAKVQKEVKAAQCNIELRPDVGYEDMKKLYEDAMVFWHACGLNETNPHLIEHFGMTTVEAMQNYCVPVVIDGGGQVEIVDHGTNGFRFKSLSDLQHYTLKVIEDDDLRMRLAEQAYEKSANYTHEVFSKRVDKLFSEIELDLKGEDIL